MFLTAGYRAFSGGGDAESGTTGPTDSLGSILAAKEKIYRRSAYSHEFIDERLTSMRSEITDECAVIHLVEAYVPTEASESA